MSLKGLKVQIYRGHQKGIEGVVVHEDNQACMIAVPDLDSDVAVYDLKSNIKQKKGVCDGRQ